MHHSYAFLLSRDDFAPGLALEDLGQEAVRWFEEEFLEGSRYEDEWCTPMGLITNEGQVLDLAPEEDLLGIHKWVEGFRNSDPASSRLQEALRLAVQIAANEMTLYGCRTIALGDPNEGDKRIDSASRETLVNDIMTQVPNRLARLYADSEGKPRPGRALGDYSYACRVRKELAIQFEEFCESAVPGFSNNRKMPHCRCFDLRADCDVPEGEDELMVLLVDIHT
ncbi:MAG: hypothetical protein WBF96_12835 [Phycisphaerae bacterium]